MAEGTRQFEEQGVTIKSQSYHKQLKGQEVTQAPAISCFCFVFFVTAVTWHSYCACFLTIRKLNAHSHSVRDSF